MLLNITQDLGLGQLLWYDLNNGKDHGILNLEHQDAVEDRFTGNNSYRISERVSFSHLHEAMRSTVKSLLVTECHTDLHVA
jgi:hypothetical protein